MFSVCLPVSNGKNATSSVICLPKITCTFLLYDLTDVEKDIRGKRRSVGDKESRLHKLPSKVGGDSDILMGITHMK